MHILIISYIVKFTHFVAMCGKCQFTIIRLVSFMLQLHVLVHLICRLFCSLTYFIALELYQYDFAQDLNCPGQIKLIARDLFS